MNRKWIALASACMVSALVLAGCGGGSAPAPTAAPAKPAASAGDVANGKAKFGVSCTACHGQDAKGMTGLGKDLHNNAYIAGLSDAAAVTFLKTGRPASDPLNTTKVDMPPKGGNPALTDKDLQDIVAYIRTLK